MKQKEFFLKYKRIYFIGIGGISMSGLASFCLDNGAAVSGSDKCRSKITDFLAEKGIKINIGHKKENVKDVDLIIYTCAICEENIELIAARDKNITCMERSDFLFIITNWFKSVIAVAGSHGKTTVSAMIAQILIGAGKEPTVLIGGEIIPNSSYIRGENNYLVIEACEYKKHFLKIEHNIGIVLNIDYDHPDFFNSYLDYQSAFNSFANKSKELVIINEKYKSSIDSSKVISFGENGNYEAKEVRQTKDYLSFTVYKNHVERFINVNIKYFGMYNIYNALCAIVLGDYLGIDKKVIKHELSCYKGVKRRYELIGKINGNRIIVDYAHHPTQIKNVILSAFEKNKVKPIVIFEPHTYTRTKALINDFVDSLEQAGMTILLPTYAARENPIKGGKSEDIYYLLKQKKKDVFYCSNYDKCIKMINKIKNSTILILGAGPCYTIGELLFNNKKIN